MSMNHVVKLNIFELIQLKNTYFPGICVSVTVGIAALFLSSRYQVPVMFMALLLGMAFNFLAENQQCSSGINFSAKTLLRTGVALLGLRISMTQVIEMGWQPMAIAAISILLTISFSVVLARKMGFNRRFGMLTGGAVAICGASAALAISSIMPEDETTRRDTLFTVIAVTSLSTIAMLIYPIFISEFGMLDKQAGLFLGGTIHDVAQVVGAGYSISDEVGMLSTFMKLVRVSFLVPVVIILGILIRKFNLSASRDKTNTPAVPFFLIGFIALFAINSSGYIPQLLINNLIEFSSFLLVTAIAALGVKTSLKDLIAIGYKPILLVITETLFIAILVLGLIYLFT